MYMRPIVTDRVAWSVGLSVCHTSAIWVEDSGGPKKACIRWVAILRGKGASYCKVLEHSAVICAKTAEPIKMPFVLWARMVPRNHVFDGGPQDCSL